MDRQKTKILELFDQMGSQLHGLFCRLTLRQDVASDLLQELFLRLSRHKGFAKARQPEAYVWRSAVNLAFEWRRKQKDDVSLVDEATLPILSAPSPLDRIVRQEELAQLLNATEKLKELPRQVVVLRYIEEKSYNEISKITGKKPSHLRSICSKALVKLRECMNKNVSPIKRGD